MSSYICATHYFGGAGIGNFWSTFVESEVTRDFERIRADGFTHIILLVPWTPFQPTLESTELDAVYGGRLDRLLHRARAANLKVILRLGYLWDVCPLPYPTYQRIKDLPTSRTMLTSWGNYFRLLWNAVAKRPVFEFAFVSWEDWYWPIYKRIPQLPKDQRVRYAQDSGYQDYLKLKYDLSDFRRRYAVRVADWKDVPVPASVDPALYEYAAFFDTVLSDRLFLAAAANFPGLSFEFRIDEEWRQVPGSNRREFYAWSTQRDTVGRQVTYYHPQVGKSKTSTHSAEIAATQLSKVLHRFSVNERRTPKPFLDQFNFHTQNPEFPSFSSIDPTNIARFIALSEKIFRQNTSGYGVWGYRDWINNKLYNGTFELGLDGWSYADIQSPEPGKRIRPLLSPGSRLEQKIIQGHIPGVKVVVQGSCTPGTVLQVAVPGQPARSIELNVGTFECLVEFDKKPAESVALELRSGQATLHRVAAYNHVLSSGLYGLNFEERPAVAAIRRLNANLSKLNTNLPKTVVAAGASSPPPTAD